MFTRTVTSRVFLKAARQASTSAQADASATIPVWRRAAGAAGIMATGSVAALAYGDMLPIMADEAVHPAHYPWAHSGPLSTFDTASIRRGYEVYKQVCSACHSLDRIAFRNLEGVIYDAPTVKALAAEISVTNKEPDDEGKLFERPGKPSDYFPAPYPNEQASRAANAGAYPPDLSVITKARHGNEDYVFSLLTGYCDPPAGVTVAEGQNYNPYFPGGKIGMGAPLYNEIIEYEDGTPASLSQLAKDVSCFLCWAAEPEHDDRKLMGVKAILTLSALSAGLYYMKRLKWSALKTRQVAFREGGKF